MKTTSIFLVKCDGSVPVRFLDTEWRDAAVTGLLYLLDAYFGDGDIIQTTATWVPIGNGGRRGWSTRLINQFYHSQVESAESYGHRLGRHLASNQFADKCGEVTTLKSQRLSDNKHWEGYV